MSIKSTQINCRKCHRKVHIMLVKCKHFNKINFTNVYIFSVKSTYTTGKGVKAISKSLQKPLKQPKHS